MKQHCLLLNHLQFHMGPVAYPGILFRGAGVSTNSVEDRENGDLGGGSSLVRGSGGSCNLVQEISFHMLKFSLFLVLYSIYDNNQFISHR